MKKSEIRIRDPFIFADEKTKTYYFSSLYTAFETFTRCMRYKGTIKFILSKRNVFIWSNVGKIQKRMDCKLQLVKIIFSFVEWNSLSLWKIRLRGGFWGLYESLKRNYSIRRRRNFRKDYNYILFFLLFYQKW